MAPNLRYEILRLLMVGVGADKSCHKVAELGDEIKFLDYYIRNKIAPHADQITGDPRYISMEES